MEEILELLIEVLGAIVESSDKPKNIIIPILILSGLVVGIYLFMTYK